MSVNVCPPLFVDLYAPSLWTVKKFNTFAILLAIIRFIDLDLTNFTKTSYACKNSMINRLIAFSVKIF